MELDTREVNTTYEDASTTFRRRAFTTKALYLAIGIHFVVLQDGHLDLLALMFDLLGGLMDAMRQYCETCKAVHSF